MCRSGVHLVHLDRSVEALQVRGVEPLQGEGAADVARGVGGQQDPAHRGGRLQPRGPVHRVAHHHRSVVAALADGAEHHLAGVDADPHPQPDAVLALHVGVEPLQVGHRPQRRADGTVRVVLVRAAGPEDGDHRVADELLHHAALGLHRRAPAAEVLAHHLAHRLGAEPGCQGGGVDEVAEQGGDQLALLAVAAGEPVAALTQRLHRGVDDDVAEVGPLLLQRRDGAVQRLEVLAR